MFLGLDVGTQGTKGVLVDEEHGIVARAAQAYGLIEGLPTGAAEQHPDTWVDAVRTVIGELLADRTPAAVQAIGVSGQQHGFVPVDGDGAVIRPAKLWCDTATSDQAARLSDALGRHVPTGFTASKILWLKETEPDAYARLHHVLLPHDYINFRLTGRMTMEPGDASGTGLFDPVTRSWDRGAIDAVDPALVDSLPEVLAPGDSAGRIHADAAAEFGLAEGTLVSTGGGDNMMSAIGSGAVTEGVVVLSLGTSGTVFSYAAEPPGDAGGLIAPFCGSAGGWLPLLCVMNLTGVTEEVRRASGLDHATLTARAGTVAAGCDGLVWLPFLAGERVPDLPTATGTLLGMRAGCLDPAVLYRAAIEGTSLNLAWGMERLRSVGVEIDELRLVGGAAGNPLWRQVLADISEVPVRRLLEPESGALGAALQAMWVARRQAPGAQDLTIQTVIEPFVGLAEEVDTPGRDVPRYREARQAFAEALDRHHGIG